MQVKYQILLSKLIYNEETEKKTLIMLAACTLIIATRLKKQDMWRE